MAWTRIISKYRAFLPEMDATSASARNEDNTPLIGMENLEGKAGLDLDLCFKFEGTTPASFLRIGG
jgi:hypothetical protein